MIVTGREMADNLTFQEAEMQLFEKGLQELNMRSLENGLQGNPPVQLFQHDLQQVALINSANWEVVDDSKNGIEYPGINPNVTVNGNRLSNRGIGWHELGQYAVGEDIRVRTGKIGTLTYIIDPRTNRPITPGYHELEYLDDSMAVYRIGAGYYKLTANQDTATRANDDRPFVLRGYPAFLFAEKVQATALQAGEVPPSDEVPPTITSTTEDPFGLEKPVDEVALFGHKVFEAALRNTVTYGSRNKQILAQLQDPDSPVLLPEVNTTELSARLAFNSYSNGSNSIHLSSADGRGGFILVEDLSGNVTIMDSSLSKVTGRDDLKYTKFLEEAQRYLEMYFSALNIQGSAEVLSAESVFDIRKQLGEMSAREARKTIKKALRTDQ